MFTAILGGSSTVSSLGPTRRYLQLWRALQVFSDELDEAFYRLDLLAFTTLGLWFVTSVDR
jgi:hypothetical protein